MMNHEQVLMQRRIDMATRELITKNRDIAGAIAVRIPEMLQEIEQDEQAAHDYTDQHGNHPFVKEDGMPDVLAHKKFLSDTQRQPEPAQAAPTITKPEGAQVH
jgi:hypothetical protein